MMCICMPLDSFEFGFVSGALLASMLLMLILMLVRIAKS